MTLEQPLPPKFGPFHGLIEAERVIVQFQAHLLASDLPSKLVIAGHLSSFDSSANHVMRSLQKLEAEASGTLDR
jgi:hypothetical protein